MSAGRRRRCPKAPRAGWSCVLFYGHAGGCYCVHTDGVVPTGVQEVLPV